MLTQIFETLTSGANSFITFFKSLLESVITIFYTAGESGAAGTLTDVGILTIVGVSVSFVLFGLRWITKLIKLRG